MQMEVQLEVCIKISATEWRANNRLDVSLNVFVLRKLNFKMAKNAGKNVEFQRCTFKVTQNFKKFKLFYRIRIHRKSLPI